MHASGPSGQAGPLPCPTLAIDHVFLGEVGGGGGAPAASRSAYTLLNSMRSFSHLPPQLSIPAIPEDPSSKDEGRSPA